MQPDNLEGKIYRNISEILDDEQNKKSIREEYPDPRSYKEKYRLCP